MRPDRRVSGARRTRQRPSLNRRPACLMTSGLLSWIGCCWRAFGWHQRAERRRSWEPHFWRISRRAFRLRSALRPNPTRRPRAPTLADTGATRPRRSQAARRRGAADLSSPPQPRWRGTARRRSPPRKPATLSPEFPRTNRVSLVPILCHNMLHVRATFCNQLQDPACQGASYFLISTAKPLDHQEFARYRPLDGEVAEWSKALPC
jgi:hypothetical protein